MLLNIITYKFPSIVRLTIRDSGTLYQYQPALIFNYANRDQ